MADLDMLNMKIIAEVENTLNGDITIVKNEEGFYSIGVISNGYLEIKHPNINADECISALAHYIQGEAYKRNKLENK